MSYELVGWENKPSTKTAVGAKNLKHMDKGIKDAHDFMDSLPEWLKEGGKPNYTAEEVGAYSKEQTVQLLYTKANAIISSASGETILTTDSANTPLVDMTVYGKSTQDGTPTIENPIEIASHGDKGSIEYGLYGGNLCQPLIQTHQKDGVTFEFANGYVTVSGTNTGSKAVNTSGSCLVLLPTVAGTYSITKKQGNVEVNVQILKADNTYIYSSETYTLDGTEQFAKMYFQVGVGATANETIPLMCNYGTELLPYTPYVEKQPLSILTPNGLRGIPIGTTIPDAIKNSEIHMRGVYWDDEDGQYYIADTREYGRGKDVQRILKTVFDGSSDEKWSVDNKDRYLSSYYLLNENIIAPAKNSINANALCTHATITSADKTYLQTDFGFAIATNPQIYFYFGETEPNLESWVSNLSENPITVYTVLQDPIETDIPQEKMAQYNTLMMNNPNTTILNDEGAYTEVEYVADTKRYIDNKFKELEANVTSAIAQLL